MVWVALTVSNGTFNSSIGQSWQCFWGSESCPTATQCTEPENTVSFSPTSRLWHWPVLPRAILSMASCYTRLTDEGVQTLCCTSMVNGLVRHMQEYIWYEYETTYILTAYDVIVSCMLLTVKVMNDGGSFCLWSVLSLLVLQYKQFTDAVQQLWKQQDHVEDIIPKSPTLPSSSEGASLFPTNDK